jgi:hypothetical protein
MAKKPKKESIVIPRKAMYGIAPAIAIIALLLSKKQPGQLLLFIIGIVAGVLIARGYLNNTS